MIKTTTTPKAPKALKTNLVLDALTAHPEASTYLAALIGTASGKDCGKFAPTQDKINSSAQFMTLNKLSPVQIKVDMTRLSNGTLLATVGKRVNGVTTLTLAIAASVEVSTWGNVSQIADFGYDGLKGIEAKRALQFDLMQVLRISRTTSELEQIGIIPSPAKFTGKEVKGTVLKIGSRMNLQTYCKMIGAIMTAALEYDGYAQKNADKGNV